jgi:transposase-like protein
VLKGRGFADSFLAVNARATNEYSDRWALAYIYNRYMNPHESSFFQENGIRIDESALAVSDLLQWIWRSRIRNGQPVSLYLPSSRMRSLLFAWSRYEI